MRECDKSAAVHISAYFSIKSLGHVIMLTVDRCFEMKLFKHLSQHVFGSPQFPKHICYYVDLLFQNVQNLMHISGKEQKIQKKFFVA